MNYQWHYDKLIETRKIRIPDDSMYYEQHHIIPVSIGGTNEESNLIKLTAREHFLAHWLLWRIHRNRQMAYAFWRMCTGNKQYRYNNISSRMYHEARKSFSGNNCSTKNRVISAETRRKLSVNRANLNKSYIGEGNPMFGKTHTEESKEKMRFNARNRTSVNGMKGRKHNVESILKISENRKGTHLSEEHKRQISEYNSGKVVSIETREKMGAWQRGRTIHEETRKKMSEAAKNRKNKLL